MSFKISIPENAQRLIRLLGEQGHTAYVVGGCVRDSLMGRVPHDWDICTSATPQQMLEIFKGIRVIETGLKHGTVTAVIDGEQYECTVYRIDGEYTDNRRPDNVTFTDDITEDLKRRDFTVNAMAYNCTDGLADPFDGIGDIERRIIKCVGSPAERFNEDALRIMRAFRFSAQLGFKIEEKTLAAASECREGLSNIARERIFSELLKLLHSPCSADALKQMRESGVMRYILGDYCPSERIFSLISSMPDTDEARLGMLLFEAEESQRREMLLSLKCSNRQKSGALAVAEGAAAKLETRADVSRFLAKYGRDASDALCASVLLGNSDESVFSLADKNNAPRGIGDLAVGGGDMVAIGLRGKEIGDMLALLLEIAIESPECNTKERLLKIADSEKKKIKDRNKDA